MKNKKITQILGGAVLAASIGIAGCSVQNAEETTKDTEKETTEATTTKEDEEEDYCCGCVVDEDFDDEQYYSSPSFVSTNGELEGQSEYMTLCPDWDTVDWERAPRLEDMTITDLSVFEDEDIRELAQSYADEGYCIHDPEKDRQYGNAFGDGEYQFSTGFTAHRVQDDSEEFISIYKMNEVLFNYFLVDYYDMGDATYTDDGTVIRYSYDDYYVEFNRDTGMGCIYSFYDMAEDEG